MGVMVVAWFVAWCCRPDLWQRSANHGGRCTFQARHGIPMTLNLRRCTVLHGKIALSPGEQPSTARQIALKGRHSGIWGLFFWVKLTDGSLRGDCQDSLRKAKRELFFFGRCQSSEAENKRQPGRRFPHQIRYN